MGANYLLLGPETGRKNDCVDSIISSLPPDTERHSFYPYDDYAESFAGALANASLFSPARFVRLDIPEEYTSAPGVRGPNYIKKDLAGILASYYAKPDPDVTFVLTLSPTQVNKEIDAFFSKKDPGFIKQIFWEMKDNEKPAWVRDFFARRNMGVSNEAISRILLLVENNSAELRSICSRLALCFQLQKSSLIDEDGVDAYLSHTRQENGYSLFALIAKGDLEASLECVDSILISSPDKTASVFSALVWSFRRLNSVLAQTESGIPQNAAFNEATVLGARARIARPNDIGIYRQACLNYGFAETRRIIQTLAAAEVNLRSGGQDLQRIRLHKLIYDIIVNKGRQAELPGFPAFSA